MIYNRIPIAFNGLNRVTGPTISYQYDVRTVLVFEDLDLPQYYEVDICNEGDPSTVTMVGTSDGVLIPNAFLRTGKRVKVYIVVQGTDQGAVETRKELTLPVQVRPAREDIDPTEPEQQQIDELIELLNNAVVMAMPTGGDEGQVLAKKSNDDYDTEWVDQTGGGGGTTNYNSLSNKPQIEGVTLTGNVSASDLGLAKSSDIPTVPVESVNSKTGTVVLSASDVGALPDDTAIPTKTSDLFNDSGYITSAPVTSVNNKTGAVTLTASDVGAGTYSKPSTGIPSTDLASAVQTSLGKADTALQSVPSTYRTSADQDTIDAGKIDKPSSPATGAFLVWNGSAWVAQTLSTWQGGNY